MADPALTVAGTPRSPELRFHVNPLYCLYQYLAVQGELPREQRNPATAMAAERLRGAQHPRGVAQQSQPPPPAASYRRARTGRGCSDGNTHATGKGGVP
jgi:hypothetical protein